MQLATLVLLALLTAPAAACTSPSSAGSTPASVSLEHGTGTEPQGRRSIFGSQVEYLEDWTADVTARLEAGRLVGVLPFVTSREGTADAVKRHGVSMAREVHQGLRDRRRGIGTLRDGGVLSPADMEANLRLLGAPRSSLYRLDSVALHGDRMGVDVVVFGTLTYTETGRRSDAYTAEFIAYDLIDERQVGDTCVIELAARADKDRIVREDRATAWTASQTLESDPGDLQNELRVATQVLGGRVARFSKTSSLPAGMVVYLAPADSSVFSSAVAELNATEAAYWREFDRRADLEIAEGEKPWLERPFNVRGMEFTDMHAAGDHLAYRRQLLTESDGFRFCRSISSLIYDAVRPHLAPQSLYRDLGFTTLNDHRELEGRLSSGGLANDRQVRTALREQGIGLVLQPRFERFGSSYSLRLDLLDLQSDEYLSVPPFQILQKYVPALAEELEVVGDIAAEPVVITEKSWADTHDRVATGVMLLYGETEEEDGTYINRGTAFVVSRDGLVMTNHHVIEPLLNANRLRVITHDGSTHPIQAMEVAAVDPFQDIAVVRLTGLPEGMHVFEFAPEPDARLGSALAVIGYPRDSVKTLPEQSLLIGFLSSKKQFAITNDSQTPRPSYMYTCPTRGGASGSPVILQDGRVVAVHSHGTPSDVKVISTSSEGGTPTLETGWGELTGFAKGVPGFQAHAVLERISD